jgi:hypothetical protein
VRAYDKLTWRHDRPRSEIKFPEVKSRVESEFLAPPDLWFVNCMQDKDGRRARWLPMRRRWRAIQGSIQSLFTRACV